jgi:hypothetical protein
MGFEVGMTVILPYDPAWTALAWAKENCPSYITNEGSRVTKLKQVPGGWVNVVCVVYHFSDEKDAVMFSLRWS